MSLFRRRKRERLGDQLTARYLSGEPGVRRMWDLRLAEGLTLEDLRDFYNEVSPEEIEVMVRQDNLVRSAVWRSLIEDRGMTESEATDEAKRCLAFYGSPDPSSPPSGLEGEDRPIPHELKLRVNGWLARQATSSRTVIGLPKSWVHVGQRDGSRRAAERRSLARKSRLSGHGGRRVDGGEVEITTRRIALRDEGLGRGLGR